MYEEQKPLHRAHLLNDADKGKKISKCGEQIGLSGGLNVFKVDYSRISTWNKSPT